MDKASDDGRRWDCTDSVTILRRQRRLKQHSTICPTLHPHLATRTHPVECGVSAITWLGSVDLVRQECRQVLTQAD